MDTRFKTFVSVVLAVFFAACSKAENPPSEYTLACVQDVSYTADGQCMDIYYAGNLEPGKKLPVMVCVHGSAWMYGDKSQWTGWHAAHALENGYMSVSVNFNMAGHPKQVRDISKAIKWVYENIALYGGDKHNIFLFGVSSGSHLVSLVSTDERYLKEAGLDFSYINGVCAYDGGSYLYSPHEITIYEWGVAFIDNFGRDMSKWEDVIPYYHIAKGKGIPDFVLVAENDANERIIPNKAFAKKLRKNSIGVKTVFLDGYDHTTLFTDAFFKKDVSEGIFMYFDKHLKK